MLHRPPWTNHRTPGAIPGSECGRSEERSGVTAVGVRVWDAREPLERLSSATVTWNHHRLPGAMASEVVCGLVFRLLLPVCLAAGESHLPFS